jgi:DNA-binding protein HU-beta
MNHTDLVKAVATELGSMDTASSAVDAVIAAVKRALAAGEEVTLYGLGKFTVEDRPASQGRNPRTGERITINAKRRAKFKPAKALRDELNQGPERLTGGKRNGGEARL